MSQYIVVHQQYTGSAWVSLQWDAGTGGQARDIPWGQVRLTPNHSQARDIPWEDIAFPSTRFALERYLADRTAGLEGYHLTELTRRIAG